MAYGVLFLARCALRDFFTDYPIFVFGELRYILAGDVFGRAMGVFGGTRGGLRSGSSYVR